MAINIESLPVGIYMQSGNGVPTHISPKGTEYTDLDTAIVYINKDGIATWAEFLDSTYSFTGGTVSGATFFSGGLSATTFSATTYFNLPTDIRVTGGTYGSGSILFTNNTGGTFMVTGLTTPFTGGTVAGPTIFTGGVTANTISATTYYNLPNDLPISGTTGQILAKNSNTNYDVTWIDNYTSELKHIVKAGEAISKGQAVYVSSANGTNIIVSKASNTTEATSSKTLGLLAQDLALNGQGFVITEGLLAGLNTGSANAGDPVWLGTGGNLIFGLLNKPVAPAHLVYIGVVTRVQIVNGEIFVKVQNGFELNELHDVLITGVTNGDLLSYDSATSLWENSKTLDGSYNVTGALSANTISATTIYSPTLDDFLYDKFMTNQYAYFLPSDSTATYSGLRTAGGTILSTGSISSLVENPMGILFTTPIAVGSVTAQYGTVFGVSSLGVNFQFETIRKFRINTNNGAQRLFVGISSLYSASAPTNVDPLTLINSIGVAKLQSGGTLNFVWNDASGTASYLDLGPNFLGTATTVTYKLKISKTFGVAAINLELTRITNSTGAVLVTGTTITSDYNTGVSYYPVAWMGNNTGVSGAVSFKDYGCQLFKRNAISS
jgi:hypothetical protein